MPEEPSETEPRNHEEQESDFELKKTKFFSSLALSVKDAFAMHRKQGLLEKDEDGESWRNVSEHCLMEIARVDALAEKLGLSQEIRRDLKIAAGLHDFYKKEEIALFKEKGMTWQNMMRSSNRAEKKLKQQKRGGRLRGERIFSDRVVRLTNSVGLASIAETDEILDNARRGAVLSDEEKAFLILHYVDTYTIGSEWVEPAKNLGSQSPLGVRITRDMLKYEELDEAGREHLGGESSYAAYRRVGQEIEQVLGKLLEYRRYAVEPEYLPNFVDVWVKNAINNVDINK